MKKILKFVSAGLLAISAFASFLGIRNMQINKVNAAIPEGQSLDTNVDTLNVTDLTIDGLTNQTMVAQNKNQDVSFSFSEENTNKSLIFKFKYEIVGYNEDREKNDGACLRVHMDVADDKWNTDNAFMIRPDNLFLSKWNGTKFSWATKPAISNGTYDIEFGRIALLEGGTPTNNYYVYYKINGTEVDSCINPYDISKMGNTMFLNIGVDNPYNKIYDTVLTYEDPQVISVNDLQKSYTGNILAPSNAYKYDQTDAPANKSVTFVANLVNKANDYANFFIGGEGSFKEGSKDVQYNWYNGGCISPRQDKVCIYKTDENGYVTTSVKEVKYSSALEIGADKVYRIEYGRQAIMNGSTFTGRYHVYYKIDGQLIYAIDQKLLDGVAAGGYFRIGGFDNDLVDVYTYETPKVISVADLKMGGNSIGESHAITTTGGETFTWDNSDHTTNYSIDFKCKYTPVGTSENQFHFNKTDIWSDVGSFIVNRSNSQNYVGIYGWKPGSNFAYTSGNTYDLEYVRKAVLLDGKFMGKYYICLTIDGNIIKEGICSLPEADAKTNQVFVSPGDKQSVIADYRPTTYETADEISVGDLKLNGNLVGESFVANSDKYTYTATAEHKSVIFTFDLVRTDATKEGSQIHFKNGWLDTNGGCVWLRHDKNMITKMTEGYATGANANWLSGKNRVEIGKLYITGGPNVGKYYIYVKVNGTLENSYIVDTMPDENYIFITKGTADTYYEINPTTYETPDQISVGDLKKSGSLVGEDITLTADTNYTYAVHAEHNSVEFSFLLDVPATNAFDTQVHFNSGYLGVAGGMVWINNKVYIQKKADPVDYVASSTVINETGIYKVTISKIYITGGKNQGKYLISAKINDALVASYVIDSMPDTANVFLTGKKGNHMYDVDYVFTKYETPDYISVSDLNCGGYPTDGALTLDYGKVYNYDATAAHKSVVFKFIYEVTALNVDSQVDELSCQIHFNDTWLGTNGGTFWFRDDKNRISKMTSGYLEASPFAALGLYNVEVGKLYITSGSNAGKYYLYMKVEDDVVLDYVIDSMPEKACVFTTGADGNHIYDVDYMNAVVNSGLYLDMWDESMSGIQFVATLDKALADFQGVKEAGFVLYPTNNSEAAYEVKGKLVANGNNYTVKAAMAGFDADKITDNYTAKAYVKLGNDVKYVSKACTTSFYNEIEKGLAEVAEPHKTVLASMKAGILNVSVDEDTMVATGATKSGDASTMVLTGANASYDGFILNGKVVKNNTQLFIGYTQYKVTLGANTITLTKQTREMVWGGSEHFVELNSGHDDNMTATNLVPMTQELGLESVRLDVYLGNLFSLTSNNEIRVNYDVLADYQGVIDTLKAGGVNDFLGVLWTVLPSGYRTWTGKPWDTNTAPAPSDTENYLKWLQINGECARLAAELLPDIHNFETWNEAELSEVLVKVTSVSGDPAVATAVAFTTAEKAQILTDLMYYYNKGIKAANPDNILTTPSICFSQQTSDRFEVTSVNFLNALYVAINDNTPVTGYTELDKDANNYFQVINIHPYIGLGTTVSNWTAFVNSFSAKASLYGDAGTQVWITEFGFPQNRYSTAQADMLNILGQAKQIDCLTRFYFYKVHDYTNKIDSDRWGLYNYDGTIKAIGTAVKDVINPAE